MSKDNLKMASAQFHIDDLFMVDALATLERNRRSRASIIREFTMHCTINMLRRYSAAEIASIPGLKEALSKSFPSFANNVEITTIAPRVEVAPLEDIQSAIDAVGNSKMLIGKIANQVKVDDPLIDDGSDVIIQSEESQYDTTKFGAPNICPCCGADRNDIGQPEVNSVKSASDWGSWGCCACGSNGRWYDKKPYSIITNTQAESDLPVSREVQPSSL